ncbi:MAG: GGDEF domain-containing phosphodiesterase [Lachnospiraceae bacterium]|nr:GGDEF domain-containing phosphodiesterase [Lachnospiraceae bacterium]
MEGILKLLWNSENGISQLKNNSQLAYTEAMQSDGLDGFLRLVVEEDRETYEVFLHALKNGLKGAAEFAPLQDNHMSVSVRMCKSDGMDSYHNTLCFFRKDDDGAVVQMTMVVCEMTAEEIYRMQLAQTVTNDSTPTTFLQAAHEVIRQEPGRKYALVQFDVVKFKMINEMYGEQFGDEMLNFFIESLQVLCNKDQLFVRLTADVFMILVPHEDRQEILDFIEIVRKTLSGYKGIDYQLVFGVSYIEDVNGILRKYGDRAAMARQSIKGNALQHVAFYENKMKDMIYNRKYLEDHMESALENREFVMYLQPKYNMENNRIVGAEALVRWVRKDGKVIPPSDFVPFFEKNGFVTKMDAFIWEEACKLIREWMDQGREVLPISVNMSRKHFQSEDYLDTLRHLIDNYRIPKEYLEIEITETVDENETHDNIMRLKEEGFTLLMDDFGSGYSSLNVLKDTQFDIIKIDRAFLQDFLGSDRGQKIVENIVRMTSAIGLPMVAEGVETKEQAESLLQYGCNVAQGFYYARPMTVEEFQKRKREQENREKAG